ncbi:MAG: fumarylacetoacetate hydrolase family protein [Ancalomicrobiaceae bacterium]|nr:fumarylacetoacetate hydrolase family protein [Ancalomicrobiaceae bacterium]
MRLASYSHNSEASYGVVLADRILDLPRAARISGLVMPPPDLASFIAAGDMARDTADVLVAGHPAEAILDLADVRFIAPIPRPSKNIFCIGRNYVDHIKERQADQAIAVKLPEAPQIFTKAPTTVIGPDDTFGLDSTLTAALDYEVELAVIIGTTGRNISRAAALSHVFGYSIGNDITARDLQKRHEQWFKGKSLDRSCPFGPLIVTADEVPDYRQFELSLTVNGEERQRAFASQMIFDVPEIIATLSAGMTLEAGDIILTGTPSGVGAGFNPPRFLKAGDEVVCTISSIGRLATRIVAA